MKKERFNFKKIISAVISFSMMASLVSVNASADTSDSVTLNAEYDTCIREDNGGETSTTNYSSETNLQIQRNGNYDREVWVRFNLNDISVPAGKQIDTAKIKVYFGKVELKNTTDTVTNMRAYKLTNEDYVDSEVTWSSYRGGTATSCQVMLQDTLVATTQVAFSTECTSYEFDISDYLNAQDTLSGGATFAFIPETSNVSGYIYSKEYDGGVYTPTLTVTFKDLESETRTVFDSAFAREDTVAVGTTGFCAIQNAGTGAYDRMLYMMFDTSEFTVPENKVVTSAKVQVYVAANYYGQEANVRLANITDDDWSSSTIVDTTTSDGETVKSWDNAPNANGVKSGINGGVSLSGVTAVSSGTSNVVNEWFDFDVTEFVTEQMHNDESGLVSFAIYPDNQRTGGNKSLSIGTHTAANYEPRLVLEYGEASPVAFGQPTFSRGNMATVVTNPAEEGATFVNIPVSGASEEPVSAKIYIAQYYSGTNELVGINVRDLEVYSGNGTVSFGYYPIGFDTEEYDCYTRVFIWDGNIMAELTDDIQADMVASE